MRRAEKEECPQALDVEMQPDLPTRGIVAATVHIESPGTSESVPVDVPGSVVLNLPAAGGPWNIDVIADGYWAASLVVPENLSCGGSDGTQLQTVLRRVGRVEGSLTRKPESLKLGRSLEIQFETSPGSARGRTTNDEQPISRDKNPCAMEEERFVCNVPAGALDLRLEADGFRPWYFWDQVVSSEKSLDLGLLRLQRGSCLAGWVELDGQIDDPAAAVTLVPQVTGWIEDPAQRRRLGTQEFETLVNDRGFFQLTGLGPGVFSLTAVGEGFAPRTVEEIEIGQDQELFLGEPIVLRPPQELSVFIDPPQDPNGHPWLVELSTPKSRSRVVGIKERSPADLTGRWAASGLSTGSYFLEVLDRQDNRWMREKIEIREEGQSPVFFKLESVEVRGVILRGGEPVETSLVFGSRYRRPNVRLHSDEEGEFRGILPRQGEWALEVGVEGGDHQNLPDVEVLRHKGEDAAYLTIEIPDTAVAVKVTRGGNAAGAQLLIRSVDTGQAVTSRRVDESGELTVRGLAPGKYSIRAFRKGESSEPEIVDAKEAQAASELSLELVRESRFEGRVSYLGTGVAGARIFLFPAASDGLSWNREGVTDALGRFDIEYNAAVADLDVLVLAAGLGSRLARFRTGGGVSEITLSPSRGTLVINNGALFDHSLIHHQAAIPIQSLIAPLLSAGFEPLREGIGLVLESLSPGPYFLCPSGAVTAECKGGEVVEGGELVVR